MAKFSYIPNRVIDTNGISDGANIYFYTPGTTTPVTIYSDAGFTTPVSNPYPVSSGAAVPALYHNESGGVRVKVVDSSGNTVSDDDPWSAFAADVVSTATGDDLQDTLDGYATRTALKAITSYAGARSYLTEAGREGEFVFRTGNYSSEVTADTNEGVYIKADDAASSSGAWIRVYSGPLNAKWFGVTGDGTTDDTTNFQAAIDFAKTIGVPVYAPSGMYIAKLQFRESAGNVSGLIGDGMDETVIRCPSTIGAEEFILDIYHPTLGNGITGLATSGIFRDFTIDGEARTRECHGIRVDGGNILLQNVAVRAVDGWGIRFSKDQVARECLLDNVVTRWCGRSTAKAGTTDCAAVEIGVEGSNTLPANNIYSSNLLIVYPMWAGLRIWGDNTTAGNSRDFYFKNLMLHGPGAGGAGAMGCELGSDAGMVLLEGNISNIVLDAGFVTQIGTAATSSWAFNIKTGTKAGQPKRWQLTNFTCDTSPYGGLINIEEASGGNVISGIVTDGTASNYPDGHIKIGSGVTGDIHLSDSNVVANTLCLIPYSIANQIRADGEITFTHNIAADAAASDTILQLVGIAPRQMFVKDVRLSFTGAITADVSNYAKFILYSRPSGGASAEFGRLETDSSSVVAYTPVEITPSSATNIILSENEQLVFQKAKQGTGVSVPEGVLQITVTPYRMADGL